MRRVHRLAASLIGLLVLTGPAPGYAQGAPELVVESVDGTSAPNALGRIDEAHLRTIVRLVGLADPGEPIRVLLASEHTPVARGTPQWIAGVAHGPSSTVLLFPSRSPRYPHDSLTAVLHHEVAHILIHRAADGHELPRWFNEGLATVAERAWTFEDRRQLAWALATGKPVRMRDVNAAFSEGPDSAARAYALGSAFVRDIIDTHGIEAPAAILRRVGQGIPFDAAFEEALGRSLDEAERAFSEDVTSWERWVPLLTSPFVLWTATTLLAVYAIFVFRLRRSEIRKRWDEEEEDDGHQDEWRDDMDPEIDRESTSPRD